MDLIISIIFAFTTIYGSCYRAIDSSILQEFFSSVSKFLSCNEKKQSWEKVTKKNEEWI